MNKIFYDIAIQAGQDPANVEYFAELLIEKCAQIMDDDYYEEHAPYSFGAKEKLDKYFGITVEHTGD